MIFDNSIVKKVYKSCPKRVFTTRQIDGKPLTLPEIHILNLSDETLSYILNEVDYVVLLQSLLQQLLNNFIVI